MSDQRTLMIPRVDQQVATATPAHGNQRGKRTRIPEFFIIATQQPSTKPEQCRAAIGDAPRLDLLFEERCPAVLQLRELRALYAAKKQMLRHRPQPRLGRDHALIQLLEPLSPPGELDRAKRRLRRAHDDIAHRGIDLEERLECGPQIHRKEPKHLRAISVDRGG
jgi:hypothetical protein